MAARIKSSRTQVDRRLDPQNDITLGSLRRAAEIVGRRVTVEIVKGLRRVSHTNNVTR